MAKFEEIYIGGYGDEMGTNFAVVIRAIDAGKKVIFPGGIEEDTFSVFVFEPSVSDEEILDVLIEESFVEGEEDEEDIEECKEIIRNRKSTAQEFIRECV